MVQSQENVDACCQRWFYGGKLLGDKILVEDAHIQSGYIVQVIVNTEHYNHNPNSQPQVKFYLFLNIFLYTKLIKVNGRRSNIDEIKIRKTGNELDGKVDLNYFMTGYC